jgi:hypothetical protein
MIDKVIHTCYYIIVRQRRKEMGWLHGNDEHYGWDSFDSTPNNHSTPTPTPTSSEEEELDPDHNAHVRARSSEMAVMENDCPDCHKKGEPCWLDKKGRRFVWDGFCSHTCVDLTPEDFF